MKKLPDTFKFDNLVANADNTATITYRFNTDWIRGEASMTVRQDESADRCIDEAAQMLADFLESVSQVNSSS